MVFLDNASTTKVYDESLIVFNKINRENYYNASAFYRKGVESKELLNQARNNIIKLLGGNNEDKLIFTSGATESNNTIIRSSARSKNAKYLFSIGEHPSVFNVAKDLLSLGYNVVFLPLNRDGKVDENVFKKEMTDDVCFISIMLVSNETGAINDIKSLVSYAKSVNPRVIFHTDAVQAFGKIKINIRELGVDALTISAHKVHGIKGIGALYIRKGVNLKPLLLGGGQEENLRSGTENLAGVCSFSKSCELAISNLEKNQELVSNLSKLLKKLLSEKIKGVKVNSPEDASPYIISCSIPNVRAESILYMMEDAGFIIGNGSACSSKKKENRTLSAMGVDENFVEGALRISFSEENTEDEIINFAEVLEKNVKQYLENTNRR